MNNVPRGFIVYPFDNLRDFLVFYWFSDSFEIDCNIVLRFLKIKSVIFLKDSTGVFYILPFNPPLLLSAK